MPRVAKGKKKAQGVEVDEVASLLTAIHQQGLSEADILRILKVDRVLCDHLKSPCRANKKDNVACFCQLVPAETSYRKKGLWQKEQTYLNSLGADPVEQRRENSADPAGLRNLGNTCYANAALQCLFSIPSLRNVIYHAEPQVAAHDIFRQLQSLFLQLQFGPQKSVDTEALAKTLGLDHAVQQDGQEFLKLLLMRVEQLLSKSNDPAARGLVRQLFRGGLSYVTTCQRCGRDSPSSRDVQDFYDLMPQVRGYTALTTSLASLLHPEALTGDNQYRCEFCAAKVDALRRVRLRSLPPYLCLALQRFYFDPRTADKAKALDKFSFPLHLDFRRVLREAAAAAEAATAAVAPSGGGGAGAGDKSGPAAAAAPAAAATATAGLEEVPEFAAGTPAYELAGILIHKGSQASSGHYVAHIKDQASGQWWRFDDESAECIGPYPTAAFQQDHGASSAAAAAAAGAAGTGGSTETGAGDTKKTTGGSRRRPVAIGDDPSSDDPDYEDADSRSRELPPGDEDAGEQSAGGSRGGRGRKRGAPSRKRGGRPAKRGGAAAAAGAGGGGRGRSRRGASAASRDGQEDGEDEDEEMQRAMRASLELMQQQQQQQNDSGADCGVAEGEGEEDEEEAAVRRAMAASMVGQQGRGPDEDAVMAAVMAESARAHAQTEAAAEAAAAVADAVDGGVLPAAAAGVKDEMAEEAAEVLPPPSRRRPLPRGAAAAATKQQEQQAAKVAAQRAAMEGSQKGEPPLGANSPVIVSANAYMLVYRAVGFVEPPAVAQVSDLLVPELRDAVSELAAAFMEQCDVYVRQRQALKDQVEARRRDVREVMTHIAPGQTAQQPSSSSAAAAAASQSPCNASPSPPRLLPTQQQQQQQLPEQAAGAQAEEPKGNSSEGSEGSDRSSPGAATTAATAAAIPTNTCGFWVATSWLERWANDEGGPPPIDNSPIVCMKHGLADGAGGEGGSAGAAATRGSRLDPRKVTSAKLVSPSAWVKLQATHGGGPTLAAGDVCLECLSSSFSAALLGSQADGVRMRVAALLEETSGAAEALGDGEDAGAMVVCGQEEEEDGGGGGGGAAGGRRYWVSRSWLQGWSRRQGASIKAEQSPTAALLCPHRQLLPASIVKTARRIAVPADIWFFLRDLWRQQKLQEAKDEASAAAAAAAANASSVCCLDLTEEDEPQRPPATAAAPAAASSAEDEDDDVIDTTPEPPPSAAAVAAPTAKIPTPQELDTLCPELLVGRTRECAACRVSAGEAAVAQADNRKQLEAERTALGGLAAEVVPYLEAGERYFMVPSSWVREWQLYVKGGAPRSRGTPAAAVATPGANPGSSAASATA
ncbi:hypothetical protein Agub_g358, partial [Astrephomene gubernaculifera]